MSEYLTIISAILGIVASLIVIYSGLKRKKQSVMVQTSSEQVTIKGVSLSTRLCAYSSVHIFAIDAIIIIDWLTEETLFSIDNVLPVATLFLFSSFFNYLFVTSYRKTSVWHSKPILETFRNVFIIGFSLFVILMVLRIYIK